MCENNGGIMDENIFLHLKHLSNINRRPRSIDCRRLSLERLLRYAIAHETDLFELSYVQLEDFLDRGLGPQARATEISHIKSYFKWAIEMELTSNNPAFRLQRPRVPRKFPRPMNEHDKALAFREAPQPIRAWLYLAAYAGLRACEIAPIRGEDIMFSEGILVIPEQKGGDPGTVALHPLVKAELRVMYKKGWLFEKGGGYSGHITAGQLQRHANKHLRDLGIESTFHSLRHWFGTEIYRSSRNIRLTQEAMRHGSVVTTALYTQIDKHEIANVISSLPRTYEREYA